MILEQTIPALTGEKAQYLVHEFNDNTIRFVLHYPGRVNPEIMSRGVEAVIKQVDVLHGSFQVCRGKAVWHIYDQIPVETYFRQETVKGNREKRSYEVALEPIRPEDPVKMRCVVIWDGAESSVVVCVSHLVVDGGDGKYLLGKILEAYNRILETGSAQGLTIKQGSRATEQLFAGMKWQEKLKLWRNPVAGNKNEFPFEDSAPGTKRVIRRVIPRNMMERAMIRGKREGYTANDLILAACYQVFGTLEGVDKGQGLGVSSMMDLRKHCPGGDSAGLINLAGALKTQLPQGLPGGFEETLKEIGRQTRVDKEDPRWGLEGVPLLQFATGHLPMKVLLAIAPVVYGNMSLGVTNLGNLQGKAWRLGDLCPVGGMLGGPLKKKPGVQVSVLSVDGECSLSILGTYTDGDETQLGAFLDGMVLEISQYGEIE